MGCDDEYPLEGAPEAEVEGERSNTVCGNGCMIDCLEAQRMCGCLRSRRDGGIGTSVDKKLQARNAVSNVKKATMTLATSACRR